MLVDARTNEDFVERFKKKFDAFCDRSPLFLSYTVNPNGCNVIEEESKSEKTFIFNYAESVFNNIKVIKNWLLQTYYPIMIEVNRETNDLIKWRIEKISTRKNQFLIHRLGSNVFKLYEIKMPSTTFLKRFREGQWDEFEAFMVFSKNAEFINTIS